MDFDFEDLPKRVIQHQTESQSGFLFQSICPKTWLIRDVTEKDYGIDKFLEICENNLVPGKIFAVQLKGELTIDIQKKSNCVAYYNLKPSTVKYWYNYPIPVLFIYTDLENNIVYYLNVKEYIRENFDLFIKNELTTFKIPSNNILTVLNSNLILSQIYNNEISRIDYENNISSFLLTLPTVTNILNENYFLDPGYGPEPDTIEEQSLFLNYKLMKYFVEKFNISTNIVSLEKINSDSKIPYNNGYMNFACPFLTDYANQVGSLTIEILNKIKDLLNGKEDKYWKIHNKYLFSFMQKIYNSDSYKILKMFAESDKGYKY